MIPEPIVLSSEAVVEQAIQELGPGWEVLPCDDSERGLKGYYAWRRDVVPDDHRWFAWALHGRDLKPDVRTVSVLELREFAETHLDTLKSSDDPKRLEWGFVSYHAAHEGVSQVRRVRIAHLKQGGQEDMRWLTETHDRLAYLSPSGRAMDAAREAKIRGMARYGWLRAKLLWLFRAFFPLR